MMKPSDKSLLSFTRQNPLKILLKLKKNDIPDRSRATTINDNLNMYINDHLRMYTSDYALI